MAKYVAPRRRRVSSADELEDAIRSLFEHEPDDDGSWPLERPAKRLSTVYKLRFDYMMSSIYEGSTGHKYTRLCGVNDRAVHALTRNQDVATRLFETGLRLCGDSIVAYHGQKKRTGPLRYYPPVILTFWAGFEAYLRYASHLMLATVNDVPDVAARFLRETEATLERGTVREKTRYQPVLERYSALLKFGYGYTVDRGSLWWQRLEESKEIRDYYTHVDAVDARGIDAATVSQFLESVLLSIIWPSADLQRTLHLGVYDLYDQWHGLAELSEPFAEQPFFKNWPIGHEPYQFHCNFENVDATRFPNPDELRARHAK